MDLNLLMTNLTNPVLMFFGLGIIAVLAGSDLEIPAASVKFISLYLLFSIGFKGGQELRNSEMDTELINSMIIAICVSAIIPLYVFFLLKKRIGISNAGAVAATYGSVSAVTFVSAITFLEIHQERSGGFMVAVMALMEFPAIMAGVMLIRRFEDRSGDGMSLRSTLRHALSSGSVLMIMGSLLIGMFADSKQAEGIRPFTNDIYKGFLAIFLLEMGMVTARRFDAFRKNGKLVGILAVIIPLVNGCLVAWLSGFFVHTHGNRFLLAILAASASYIAVPASMRLAAPKADPGLYIPMALGITFPFNITVGMPIYYWIATSS